MLLRYCLCRYNRAHLRAGLQCVIIDSINRRPLHLFRSSSATAVVATETATEADGTKHGGQSISHRLSFDVQTRPRHMQEAGTTATIHGTQTPPTQL